MHDIGLAGEAKRERQCSKSGRDCTIFLIFAMGNSAFFRGVAKKLRFFLNYFQKTLKFPSQVS
ncbi:hypothetical protein CD932_19705 [Janthinobacterium sp. PC23-8]|nr:hypothetical protein CD932_19705 [Janthinobacterium sp. PC23-8]